MIAEGVYVGDLRIVVHWNRWEKGMSVFVPCTDTKSVRTQMLRKARKLKYTLVTQEEVRGGVLGLRFWRTL